MNIMSFAAALPRNHGHTDIVARLLSQGYCVIENAVGQDDVAALRSDLEPLFEQTQRSVGPFYGDATKRFHGLLRRSRHMEAFVLQHDILRAVETVLGSHCDSIQLNLTQAAAPPGPGHVAASNAGRRISGQCDVAIHALLG